MKRRHKLLVGMLLAISAAVPMVMVSQSGVSIVAHAADDDSDTIVQFDNPKFADLVFANLQSENIAGITDSSHITRGQMAQLKEISNSAGGYHALENGGNGIPTSDSSLNPGNYSIEGIQYAKNITSLKLQSDLNYPSYFFYNDLQDISPLKSLTKLTSISLVGNRISDVSPLKDLKNVTELRIQNNCIQDMSMLDSSQYTSAFVIFGQIVMLPKVTVTDGSYVVDEAFKNWLPKGYTFSATHANNGAKVIHYRLAAVHAPEDPAHPKPSDEISQIVFDDPAPSGWDNANAQIHYTNLPKQQAGYTNDPTNNGIKVAQLPFKTAMWYRYADNSINPSYNIWDIIQPYVNSVSYTLVPVDQDGNPISGTSPITGSGAPGDSVNAPDVPGWTADNNTVTIPDSGGEIKVSYHQNDGQVPNENNDVSVTIHYVDSNGKTIKPDTTTKAPAGTEINAPDISGYTIDGTNKVTVPKGNTAEITFKYKANSKPINPTNPTNPSTPGNPSNPSTPSVPSNPLVPGKPTPIEPNPGESNNQIDIPVIKQGEAVYALNHIYLYKNKNFKQNERKAFYN